MAYGYKVLRGKEHKEGVRYTRQELENMGTFLLRDICVKEKIMTRGAGLDPQRLNREELIELLCRYRGRPEERLRNEFPEEAVQALEKILSRIPAAESSGVSTAASDHSSGVSAAPGNAPDAPPIHIEVPFKLTVSRNIPLLKEHEVKLFHSLPGEYFCGFLTDKEGRVRAVFEVEGQCLTLQPERMDAALEEGLYYDWQFYLFDAPSSRKVIQIYNGQDQGIQAKRRLAAGRARLPVFEFRQPPDSSSPLFFDFGSSNTCAAAADRDGTLRYVTFGDGSALCPSCAAVKECGPDGARFVFGQEALTLIQKDGYGSTITFFYNLKRFLFQEQDLTVYDEGGSAAKLSSDILLLAYFKYLIHAAEAQFGACFREIRFLLPEKRPQLALGRFRQILEGYQVEAAGSESLCCVYQELTEALEGDGPSNRLPALVVHCGGGSVSLTKCSYDVKDTEVAYEAAFEAQYLNGDAGFGGNNLTFLILQYLKVKLYLQQQGRQDSILGERFLDAYSLVDEYGTAEPVYEELYHLYAEAEARIPTLFGREGEWKRYKKQNFFRLWFLAEQIKRRFASDPARDVLRLPDELPQYSNMNLLADGTIRECSVELMIHRDEIWTLLAPEIYRVVRNFLEPLCDESGILQGCRIKFTGLSCAIPVFRDAIREFTVGRRGRTPKGGQAPLKLKAMEGAVMQEEALKSGRLVPEWTLKEAAEAYSVITQSHDGSLERLAADAQDGRLFLGSVTRHVSAREIEFSICDAAGHAVRSRSVRLERERFRQTGYDEIFREFPVLKEVQGELDSIGERDIRLFVFRQEEWDFCILPVARTDGALYRGELGCYLFDEEGADFFCGRY